jgi:hypothetical protein
MKSNPFLPPGAGIEPGTGESIANEDHSAVLRRPGTLPP